MVASRLRLIGLGVACLALGSGAMAEPIVFRHVLDNSPLEVKPRPNEVETEAVKSFKETGKNPYSATSRPSPKARSSTRWSARPAICRTGPGGSGRRLIDDTRKYPRAATDVGMFEILYGGASGAMQSFARRGMTQDQMLKVIAYVRSLKK